MMESERLSSIGNVRLNELIEKNEGLLPSQVTHLRIGNSNGV